MPDAFPVVPDELFTALRPVLDQLPECFVHLAAVRDAADRIVDFRFVDANGAACAYNRMTRDELLSRTLMDILPSLGETGVVEQYAQVVRTGRPLVLDNLIGFNSIHGQERRTESRAVKAQDGVIVMWRDVTGTYDALAALARSEERYRLLAENSSDLVLHMRGSHLVWVSPSSERLLGWQSTELVGRTLDTLLHPDDRELARTTGLDGDTEATSRIRVRLLASDGAFHWFDGHGGPFVNPAGQPDGHIAAFRLIDAEMAAERLLDRRARYDTLTGLMNRHEVLEQMASIHEGTRRTGEQTAVLFCDIDEFKGINDTYGHAAGDEVLRVTAERVKQCVRSSDFVARIGGDELLVVLNGVRDADDAVAIGEKIRVTAAYPIPVHDSFVATSLSIGIGVAMPGETVDHLMARADGAMYLAKQQGRNRVVAAVTQPSVHRVLVVDDDEFQLMLIAELLGQLGVSSIVTAHDGQEALDAMAAADEPPTVIVCDLAMGGMDGLEYLRHLADQGFTGGLIMMSGSGGDILESVRDLAESHGLMLLGLLNKPVDPRDLLQALESMEPIRPPRSEVAAHDPRIGLLTPEEIRSGIRAGHVDIFVQPKVTIYGRRVVSVEALLRWRDPQRGVISPLAVVPVAEESDLIDELTLAVYRRSVDVLATWRRMGQDVRMSVNLSTRNLFDLSLPDLLAQVAHEAGVTPADLTLELTESHLLEDLPTSLEVIGRLRLKGFGVSIDDYGMGYSNLRKLKQLPITELKVDRSFVDGADRDKHLRAILGSSVALGHSLGVTVVAEGVESPEVWSILEELGCDEVQGFIVATPMPADEFVQWRASWDAVWA